VRRLFLLEPVAPGRLTKQPRSWRGRADAVNYGVSGGCQAPSSMTPAIFCWVDERVSRR